MIKRIKKTRATPDEALRWGGGGPRMPMPLLDLDKVLKVHNAALAYTVAIQKVASANADAETAHRVTRAALSSLMHDVACLHQAILPLCATAGRVLLPSSYGLCSKGPCPSP
jgi:hypothetical protein